MTEEEERTLYWNAVDSLNHLLEGSDKTKEEILRELDEDLDG